MAMTARVVLSGEAVPLNEEVAEDVVAAMVVTEGV